MDQQQEVKQTHSEGVPFQSNAKLFALKVHAVWEKCENVVLFPFRWLARQVSATPAWEQAEGRIRLVK